MKKDTLQQLKNWKNDPRLGGVSDSQRLQAREQLMAAIGGGHAQEQVQEGGLLTWVFSDLSALTTAPIGMALMVMFVLTSGVFTTVNASASLPGERLYSVKLATERARLVIASREHKAVLHTEFAENRLEEAQAIQDSNLNNKEEVYKTVLSAFRTEIAYASEEVKLLQAENEVEETDVLGVASQVDRKITELTQVIRQESFSEDEQQMAVEIQETQKETEQVSHEVENMVVEETVKNTQEGKKQEEETTMELKERAKNTINEIYDRQAYILGRMIVIDRAIESHESDEAWQEQYSAVYKEVDSAGELLPSAMDTIARGAYTEGFATLHEIETQLSVYEQRIAEMEVEISTHLQAQTEAIEEFEEEMTDSEKKEPPMESETEGESAKNNQ